MEDNNADGLIQVWKAHGDGGERGTGPVIGYASSEHKARVMARGQGFYGSAGYVSEGYAVRVNGLVYAVTSPKPIDIDGVQAAADEQLRQAALASLTPEQRRVLGLK